MNAIKRTKGFTLLEVLVASAILFSTIAITSVIFKTAYVASEKAQNKVGITAVVPALLPIIQQSIREQTTQFADELTGNGIIWGIHYRWQAHVIAFKSPADKFDVDTTRMESYTKRYKKWLVNLELSDSHQVETSKLPNFNKGLAYQYHELSWVTQ